MRYRKSGIQKKKPIVGCVCHKYEHCSNHICLVDVHWWFSGRILACHAGGPGSIPGQCKIFFFFFLFSFENLYFRTLFGNYLCKQ